MTKLKVCTVVGTRPEIIRLSRVISKLDEATQHILVHTGQNYDPNLNEIFFRELQIRSPNYFLNVDTTSLGSVLGGVIIEIEKVLLAERPDALLVLGDTNSAVAALVAKRMHIPVYHMEAGNRSFDENVPEETNRRMVDHISDFNLAYTEHARRNLLSEGLHPRRVSVTGSPMKEVLDFYSASIDRSQVLQTLNLHQERYVMVSAHRQENVDSVDRLKLLLQTLESVADKYALPVLVSLHPRTRARMIGVGYDLASTNVQFHEPFGFFDYIKLQKHAFVVLSDSGTISEEAAILGFPAVTIRDSIERPEAIEAGCVILSGLESGDVINAIDQVRNKNYGEALALPVGYESADVAETVLRYIMSTARRHHFWAGLRQN